MRRNETGAVVVAIAGRIGSGKTTISRKLAVAFNCEQASFGDYFRGLAASLGLDPRDRELLQKIGAEQVLLSPLAVCRQVLQKLNWRAENKESLVVDGMRHLEVLNALRQAVSPLPVVLVYVEEIPSCSSLKIPKDISGVYRTHSTEMQGEVLIAAADVIITVREPVKSIVKRILHSIERNSRSDHTQG
jgi:adenylate kinase family enzyme